MVRMLARFILGGVLLGAFPASAQVDLGGLKLGGSKDETLAGVAVDACVVINKDLARELCDVMGRDSKNLGRFATVGAIPIKAASFTFEKGRLVRLRLIGDHANKAAMIQSVSEKLGAPSGAGALPGDTIWNKAGETLSVVTEPRRTNFAVVLVAQD